LRGSLIATQPYLVWHPHVTSIPPLESHPRQATLFIVALLHLAVITGVTHSWLYGSAGKHAVPPTIPSSMRGILPGWDFFWPRPGILPEIALIKKEDNCS
jgi:hypothetical protein